jgi:hypothetical protein
MDRFIIRVQPKNIQQELNAIFPTSVTKKEILDGTWFA